MHLRRSAIAVAILSLVIVAGCGGSDNKTEEKPKSDNTSQKPQPPKPQTADEIWANSLCAQIDGQGVAKALGQPAVYRGSAGTSLVGIPSFETCSLIVGQQDSGSSITFGWSVTPISESGWGAAKKYEKDTNGRYMKIEAITVGDGGYFRAPSVAVARVGNRIIRASYQGPPTTAKKMAKILALAVPVAPKLKVEPPIRELPACAKGDAAADRVMGAKATIRRDFRIAGRQTVCSWATPSAAVSVTSAVQKDAKADLKDRIDSSGGEMIAGLGESAGFIGGVDGKSVLFVTSDGTYVQVSVPALLLGSKADLIALAKDLVASY